MAALSLQSDGSLRCYRTNITIYRLDDGSCKAIHPLFDTPLSVDAKGNAWDCYKAARSCLLAKLEAERVG